MARRNPLDTISLRNRSRSGLLGTLAIMVLMGVIVAAVPVVEGIGPVAFNQLLGAGMKPTKHDPG
jgi:hypothetical protein